eukprot:scaffold258788_cov27-Tisochrysis_lutea.AAC.1
MDTIIEEREKAMRPSDAISSPPHHSRFRVLSHNTGAERGAKRRRRTRSWAVAAALCAHDASQRGCDHAAQPHFARERSFLRNHPSEGRHYARDCLRAPPHAYPSGLALDVDTLIAFLCSRTLGRLNLERQRARRNLAPLTAAQLDRRVALGER